MLQDHERECAMETLLLLSYVSWIALYLFAGPLMLLCFAAVLYKPAPWCSSMRNTLPEDMIIKQSM